MSNVKLNDADNAVYRPDTFTRIEGGETVHMQAVVAVNPLTGAPLDLATQATLAELKTVADSLLLASNAIKAATEAINDKTINTDNVGGTVSLDAPTLAALETINANTGGLTDAQLRASPLALPTGASTEATLLAVKNALDALVGNTDAVETLQAATNSALTALQGYNDSVESLLTSLGNNTDGLEALLNTLGVQTDQVEPLLTDIKAATEATRDKLPALVGGRIPVELPAGSGGLTDAELRASPLETEDNALYDLVETLNELVSRLGVLLSARGVDGSLRTTLLNTPNIGTVTTLTTLSTLTNMANQTALGGYQASPLVQAQSNLLANQANIINMVG